MIQYKYRRAAFLDDIVKMLKGYGGKTRIIAGGTDITVQIHERDKQWKDLQCLLDITYSDRELRYVGQDEEYVYIGLLSTHTGLEQSEVTAEHTPFLGWVSVTMGSLQVRDRGTLGGSIGSILLASNPFPALTVMDALIKVHSQDGERMCLFKNFYEGEGSLKFEPGEFIHGFVVKKLPEGTRMGFSKLGRRKILAVSGLNYATALTTDSEGTITEVRITSGCIFILPDGVERTKQVLIGQKPSRGLFAKAGKAVSEVMIEYAGVRWPTQYKEPAVQETVFRVLYQITGMEV